MSVGKLLPVSAAIPLSERATDALNGKRFKEAVDLLKQLTKTDSAPQWQESLATAYVGRARELASKSLFKEACVALENTFTPTRLVRDHGLYAACLIRDSQPLKAATYLLHCATHNALPATLEELTAALLVGLPQLPTPTSPESTQWCERAAIARDALTAWTEGASSEEVDGYLTRLPLRSGFRPLRILLKSLVTQPVDWERTEKMLESIAPGSPFHAVREAVEASLKGGAGLDADAWARLSAPQRAFVAESSGLSAPAAHAIGRLADAANSGPGGLFTWLLKQGGDFPRDKVRSACFNLLPRTPDRLSLFEKTFGALSEEEKLRVRALAAEKQEQWDTARMSWETLALYYRNRGDALAAGVIYRHLSRIVQENGSEDDFRSGLYGTLLKKSSEVDPDHIPTVLERLEYHKKRKENEEHAQLIDETARRLNDNVQILGMALESASNRHDYAKAIDYGNRIVAIDPINTTVHRQMLELHIAQARHLMLGKNPGFEDIANGLSAAAQWDRAETPSATLRILRGLVALKNGNERDGWNLLSEGVGLAEGEAPGWFHVAMEASILEFDEKHIDRFLEKLQNAMNPQPDKESVLSIVSVLSQSQFKDKATETSDVFSSINDWLNKGSDILWTSEEIVLIAEAFNGFYEHEMLHLYAKKGLEREPDNLEWQFYEIVGRTEDGFESVTYKDMDKLEELRRDAKKRGDRDAHKRIFAFIQNIDMDNIEPDQDKIDEAMKNISLLDMSRNDIEDFREMIDGMDRESAVEHLMSVCEYRMGGRSFPKKILEMFAEHIVDKVMSTPKSNRRP